MQNVGFLMMRLIIVITYHHNCHDTEPLCVIIVLVVFRTHSSIVQAHRDLATEDPFFGFRAFNMYKQGDWAYNTLT